MMAKCMSYLLLLLVLYITIRTSLQKKSNKSYKDCASSARFIAKAERGEQGSRCSLVQGDDKCNMGLECCNEQRKGRAGLCADIDECSNGEHSCHSEAICTNTVSGYTCTCREGFIGNGTLCKDIDECLIGEHSCHSEAICTNTVSGYTCTCREGFIGNGTSCKDVNECNTAGSCKPYAQCTNTPGSFECRCIGGYAGNGMTCAAGGDVVLNSGHLSSPNYPKEYPAHLHLTWTIIVDQGKKVQIVFAEHFMVEPSGPVGCHDYIRLVGAVDSGTYLDYYCGGTAPSAFTSPGNILTVKFVSDGSNYYKGRTFDGFSFTWTAVDP